MPEVGEALTNVWYDTAALPYLYRSSAVEAAVATSGANSILFGTDYPLLTHRRVMQRVEAAGLDPSDLEAILGGNTAALLSIPEHD